MRFTSSAYARVLVGSATAGILALSTGVQPAGAHTLQDYHSHRSHILERARSVEGSPYRSAGATPSGFDCSGFTMWVFRGHGASLPHSAMRQYELGLAEGNRRIFKRENLMPGDLVFHRTTSATVGHVGIYIGNDRFISATSSSGVRINDIYDPYYWGDLWVGGTRLAVTARDLADTPHGSPDVDRPKDPQSRPDKKKHEGKKDGQGGNGPGLFIA